MIACLRISPNAIGLYVTQVLTQLRKVNSLDIRTGDINSCYFLVKLFSGSGRGLFRFCVARSTSMKLIMVGWLPN
jgi:hypothetical protein